MSPSDSDESTRGRGALRSEPVRATIIRLRARIDTRFPGAGLTQVATELIELAEETEREVERSRKPIWWLRTLVVAAVVGVMVTVGFAATQLTRLAAGASGSLPELVQATDAAINELILLSIVIAFLVSTETRLKRRRALRLLHRLRGLAHVVDMHQLTKDPEFALRPSGATASSPARSHNRFELTRYLDYCSEMLALTSKLAALHMQHVQDGVVLGAVNEIEALVTGLSAKIWQKIMILQMGGGAGTAASGAGAAGDAR
ncbi:MAG: hypothetical protein IT349_10105 [Candidatus Eisenbacteria bacterium]|nr:hypothetical protein [Candidatus Eisenbacteria bacterium]MCC7142442.1 hypothetical protein [Candidatus Eisenbacteria bacterium]